MTNTVGGYNIRPARRFDARAVKFLVKEILRQEYSDREYDDVSALDWSKITSKNVLNTIQDLDHTDYKFIVNVMVGENRGAGVKLKGMCFWDSDADNVVSCDFSTASIFVVASVFAVYHY